MSDVAAEGVQFELLGGGISGKYLEVTMKHVIVFFFICFPSWAVKGHQRNNTNQSFHEYEEFLMVAYTRSKNVKTRLQTNIILTLNNTQIELKRILLW